jgi:hypothetical protein
MRSWIISLTIWEKHKHSLDRNHPNPRKPHSPPLTLLEVLQVLQVLQVLERVSSSNLHPHLQVQQELELEIQQTGGKTSQVK